VAQVTTLSLVSFSSFSNIYFYGRLGKIHLVNVKEFDLYAPSMNYVVADIYLLYGNRCKYDASI